MQDRGQDHPGALLVQQRHRAGLTPAHLVVGVVADHRCAADAAGDPSLVALEPALHLLEGRLDQLAELHEGDLDALGMGDQVTLAARAEHDGLRSSQLPKLCEEHEGKKQRNHRHPSGCQRGDAGGRCEVIGHA